MFSPCSVTSVHDCYKNKNKETVSNVQVESALLEHPAVEESAVVSSPDMDRGQVVKAFVVLSRTHKQIMGKQLFLLYCHGHINR